MLDTLKVVGRGFVWLLLAALGVRLVVIFAVWLVGSGLYPAPASASGSVDEQRAEAEAAYTQRAIAQHKIPPGSPRAICDTRDNLIGYWTYDKSVVIFDDKHDATQADCW